MLVHGNSRYAKKPHCCVIRTLLLLLSECTNLLRKASAYSLRRVGLPVWKNSALAFKIFFKFCFGDFTKICRRNSNLIS